MRDREKRLEGSINIVPTMDNTNTSNKRRRPARKAEDFRLAWKQLAPDATFGGKTLAEYEAAIVPFQDAVEELRRMTVSRSAALKVRNQEEASLRDLLVLVAHGVRSDPAYGEDSPLYRAMGFVPKSERSSGLVRPPSEGDPPQNEEAAA